MNIAFQHSSNVRVRYGETDRMGYCYYGNYAQYFEVGRVEALRELGLSYKKMEDEGVMLPVSEFNVKYKAPAYYDDELTVITQIVAVKGARIWFEYSIKNRSNLLIATASTTLVFVDSVKMSPIAAPKSFMDTISQFEVKN